MRRLALVGASLALLGGMTAACGGSPDDASKDDFCKAYEKIDGESFDDVKDAAEELGDVGTPKEIEGDARDGFEKMLDIVDDADNEDDATEAIDDLDSDDTKKIRAFTEKASEVCS